MAWAVDADAVPSMRVRDAVLAAAHVVEVDEDASVRAVVLVPERGTSVALLNRALRGAPDEGDVLHEVMLRTTRFYGSGLFVFERRTA